MSASFGPMLSPVKVLQAARQELNKIHPEKNKNKDKRKKAIIIQKSFIDTISSAKSTREFHKKRQFSSQACFKWSDAWNSRKYIDI